jgi:hypothetical protein
MKKTYNLEEIKTQYRERHELAAKNRAERTRGIEERLAEKAKTAIDKFDKEIEDYGNNIFGCLSGKVPPDLLHDLFLLDTWTVKDALIILAGLHPRNVPLDEQERIDFPCYTEGAVRKAAKENYKLQWVKLLNGAQLFHEWTEEILGEPQLRYILQDIASCHFEMVRVWKSGTHIENRYPPKYFIDWAISKKFDIEWLNWAIANDYYNASQKEKVIALREVSPKSESSYLNIIGALVELYWAAAHEGEEYSQAALLTALKPYEGFAGMSERNLKDKLTLAMRAIKAS